MQTKRPFLQTLSRTLSRAKRRIYARHLWAARLGVLVVLLVGVLLLFYILLESISFLGARQTLHLGRLFVSPNQSVLSTDGKINVLLLGKAGAGYTAPDLTDTIMVASIDQKRGGKITLLSIPRDLWVPELRAKINSAYYWGNQKKEGGGITLAATTIEDIIGQPIHYTAVIDFDGFKNIIDVLGGIDVYVYVPFVDERFPIPGKENDLCDGDKTYACRYETLTFTGGWTHMDGETALKYARSRHSENLAEGTDLARAKRQQNVIEGVKRRVSDPAILFSPVMWKKIYTAGRASLETTMSDDTMAMIGHYVWLNRQRINALSIPDELLINPPISTQYDNQYVFTTTDGTYAPIRLFVKEAFYD